MLFYDVAEQTIDFDKPYEHSRFILDSAEHRVKDGERGERGNFDLP